MTVNQSDTDTNLFTGVDLRAFWETLRLRWWIIPAVLTVSVGFLWAQDSDLQTEPGSFYIAKTYEARDPRSLLSSVGIDPQAIRAVPEPSVQLLLLQSPETRAEITRQTGISTSVSVVRNLPSLSLIDTRESNDQNTFVFQTAGAVSYTFSCSESVRSECESAIDAYVEKAIEIRAQAITTGLIELKELLQGTTSFAANDDSILKIAAIDVILGRLDVSFVELSSYINIGEGTISMVRPPTYTFAVGAGLIVSLLILLQLTYTDRRIRTARRVVRQIGIANFRGAISKTPDAISDRKIAIALRRLMTQLGATTISFTPLRTTPPESGCLERLGALCESEIRVSKPITEMSVAELTAAPQQEMDVIVVIRNKDLLKDLTDGFLSLRESGRRFGGVVLLD